MTAATTRKKQKGKLPASGEPVRRCPDCGDVVRLPCVACHTRRAMADAKAAGDELTIPRKPKGTTDADTDAYLPTQEEIQAATQRIRQRRGDVAGEALMLSQLYSIADWPHSVSIGRQPDGMWQATRTKEGSTAREYGVGDSASDALTDLFCTTTIVGWEDAEDDVEDNTMEAAECPAS